MILNNRFNQVIGTFPAGVDLLADGGAISDKTPEITKPILNKVGIITDAGTKVLINDADIQIPPSGVLELDTVNIRSLIFPNGATAEIDFCY